MNRRSPMFEIAMALAAAVLIVLLGAILPGCAMGIPDADTGIAPAHAKLPCEVRGKDQDGRPVCLRAHELDDVLRGMP